MRMPLEVVVRGAPVPPGLREELEAQASRLDHFYGRVMRCRATLEGRVRHPGPPRWSLRVTLTVPGSTIAVSRQESEKLSDALSDGFAAAARRLEDYARRRRGAVKTRAGA